MVGDYRREREADPTEACRDRFLGSVTDLVGNRRMAGPGIRIHRFQGELLVVTVLENPVIKTRGNKLQRDFIGALVLPEPPMDARAGRHERTVCLLFSRLVVEFITLVIIRAPPCLPASRPALREIQRKACHSRSTSRRGR